MATAGPQSSQDIVERPGSDCAERIHRRAATEWCRPLPRVMRSDLCDGERPRWRPSLPGQPRWRPVPCLHRPSQVGNPYLRSDQSLRWLRQPGRPSAMCWPCGLPGQRVAIPMEPVSRCRSTAGQPRTAPWRADSKEPLQASGRRRMALLWMWLRCFRHEANSGPNDVKERPLPVICSAFTFLKENRC